MLVNRPEITITFNDDSQAMFLSVDHNNQRRVLTEGPSIAASLMDEIRSVDVTAVGVNFVFTDGSELSWGLADAKRED